MMRISIIVCGNWLMQKVSNEIEPLFKWPKFKKYGLAAN